MMLTTDTYLLLARARARRVTDGRDLEDSEIEREIEGEIPLPLANPSIVVPGSSGKWQYDQDSA